MPAPAPDNTRQPSAGDGGGRFELTRWSIVLAAGQGTTESRAALELLCTSYWYPLYAFVRRQRYDPHEAQDLTQSFFARLIEKGWLADVDRNQGRFRSFLLASMKHFLSNEWDRARAKKRGGGNAPISLDADSAESRYATEPTDPQTPEKIFERRWALTLLEHVLSRLRAEFAAAGKIALFDELKSSLTGDKSPYAHIAQRLDMNEGAVKVAAHRLRQRYRQLIRDEVARTVATDDEVEEELRDLMAALAD